LGQFRNPFEGHELTLDDDLLRKRDAYRWSRREERFVVFDALWRAAT
jgi:hypothetical protein